MASINRPNKLTISSSQDPLIGLNQRASYSEFNSKLQTPILNAKGIQMISTNFKTSPLMLNDTNGELMFWYWVDTVRAPASLSTATGHLGCVRLVPSTYATGYIGATESTYYTRNRPVTSVDDLVALLNSAAANDDATFNPYWTANEVKFVNSAGKVMAVPGTAVAYFAPLCAEDPVIATAQNGSLPIKLAQATGGITIGAYGLSFKQAWKPNVSMCTKLGYTLKYNRSPLSAINPTIDATQTVPTAITPTYAFNTSVGWMYTNGTGVTPFSRCVPGDAYPNLSPLTTSVNVYLDIVTGSGLDGNGNKNLIATIPVDQSTTNQNYTFNSAEVPALSIPQEIYNLRASFTDQDGNALQFYNFSNTTLTFSVYY
jgi:hypothetical protein